MNVRIPSDFQMLPPVPDRARIFDYLNHELTIPESVAQALFLPHLRDPIVGKLAVLRKLNTNDPFSVIHLGVYDSMLLAMNGMSHAETHQSLLPNLWQCGIDTNNIPDPAEYASLIGTSDLVLCQYPERSPIQWWGGTLGGLIQWNLLDQRSYDEMHILFNLIGSGQFFQSLWGKRVVLVGGKALPFYNYYFNNPDYRSVFNFMGLEHINIVSIIPTPDYKSFPYNHKDNLLKTVRRTYQYKPDIFLFGAGYLARVMAVMVRDDGYVGLDIGGAFDSLMNWGDKRPGMYLFNSYQHPDYEFRFSEKDRRYIAQRRNIQ